MEEKTRWKPLIPVDLPPPLVEPGKDSEEKDIQYAREKGILQALYFNRSMYVIILLILYPFLLLTFRDNEIKHMFIFKYSSKYRIRNIVVN